MGYQPSPLDNGISKDNAYVYKQLKTHTNSLLLKKYETWSKQKVALEFYVLRY